jgi:hypothetical protein
LKTSQSFEERAKRTALNRWKLETLTGLLGLRSLKAHQSQSEANAAAENAHARKSVWGSEVPVKDETEMGHTILGDVTNPTPIVIHSQQQGSGIGKALVGAAIAAGLIGIPAAGIIGYGVSQLIDRKPVATEDNSLDVGLGHIGDLIPAVPK